MIKAVFKELIPINLMFFMVAMGIQYYKAAPREVPLEFYLTGGPPPSAPYTFWVFPVIACIVYIAFTVLQFFNERLFIPKTFFIFFLANLHIAILYYKTGEVESVLISMIPTALVLIVYFMVVFLSKKVKGKVDNSPPAG